MSKAILVDYHIHSTASSDARHPMYEMARASRERGVRQICFTDHCDLDHYATGKLDPNCRDVWPETLRQYKEACEALPGMDIRLGLELGEINHCAELACDIAAAPELDFILGSLHNLRGYTDFYNLSYHSEEQCHELLEKYLEELIEMAGIACFDVMAHIGYARRYMLNAGFKAGLEPKRYGDRLEHLFRTLIHAGKGIEYNCSGYRHPDINGPIPSKSILSLYRELGGEIITIGTDAHAKWDTGLYLEEGLGELRGIGFKYIATYKKRRLEFLSIV